LGRFHGSGIDKKKAGGKGEGDGVRSGVTKGEGRGKKRGFPQKNEVKNRPVVGDVFFKRKGEGGGLQVEFGAYTKIKKVFCRWMGLQRNWRQLNADAKKGQY